MKKGTVLSFRNLHFAEEMYRNRKILLLFTVLIAGVFAGVISFSHSDTAVKFAKGYIEHFISVRNLNFFPMFLSSLGVSFCLFIFVFICGVSVLGVVLVPLSIGIYGFGYGVISAYLYSNYSIKGIAFNAVIMVLPAVIIFGVLLFCARESISFSFVLTKLTMPKSIPANLYIDFKNYCGRFAILLLPLILASLTDYLLSRSFMKFFEL